MLKRRFKIARILLFFGIIFYSCEPEKGTNQSNDELPKKVIVKVDELRVRNGPNTMTSEVGIVFFNDVLKVIKRSPELIKIGNMKAHWYQIQTRDGLFGWVYGAYLDVELQIKNSEKQVETKKDKIREHMGGKWYVLDDENQITHWFIKINPKKKEYIAGFRNQILEIGKYKEKFKGNFIYLLPEDNKKAVFEEINGEIRGNSFILRALHKKKPKKFALTSKRI